MRYREMLFKYIAVSLPIRFAYALFGNFLCAASAKDESTVFLLKDWQWWFVLSIVIFEYIFVMIFLVYSGIFILLVYYF